MYSFEKEKKFLRIICRCFLISVVCFLECQGVLAFSISELLIPVICFNFCNTQICSAFIIGFNDFLFLKNSYSDVEAVKESEQALRFTCLELWEV